MRSFLFLQSGLERTNRYDKEAAELCIAKFKLLLEIDTTAVKTFVASFVKVKNSLGCQTEKMEASLMAAVDELQKQPDSSRLPLSQ